MGLGVPEIRSRAERLRTEIASERFRTKAGLKERPAFASIYASHAILLGDEALPAIQRELAEADGDERRRLRYLLAWVAEQRVAAALAPLEDELRAWEASATVKWGGRELLLREVSRALECEENRGGRVALERARGERLDEVRPLRGELVHREREAVAALGFGDYVEARERLSGLRVRALGRQARRILQETAEPYRAHLRWQAEKRLDAGPEQALESDAVWLARVCWLDDRFRLEAVLGAVRADLAQIGLPLDADGRVRLDLEERPLKGPRSFCAPIRVPEEVWLVVAPAGGRPDCASLLHEAGHALHFAYTDPSLPFEYRALGDTAVTEAYALLFELLSLERPWLRRVLGLEGELLEEYVLLAGFLQAYALRRQAAELLFELEMWEGDASDRPGEHFAEVIGEATGFRPDPRARLEAMERGFWVARRLRAWMLAGIVREVLRERYEEDWYRNPAAGPFLLELFSAGQREDASRLAAGLGRERLGAQAAIDRALEWLP